MADLIPPRRDEILSANGVGTRRFMEYLEKNATDTNTLEGDRNRISTLEGSTVLQSALVSRLSNRVDDLERSSSGDMLNARLSRVSARMDALIDELIAEVIKAQPDLELQNKMLCLQRELLTQIQLLNARTEEAYETDIEADDL